MRCPIPRKGSAQIITIKELNPPNHWSIPLQRRILLFNVVGSEARLMPVVVKPESDSKLASRKLVNVPFKKSGKAPKKVAVSTTSGSKISTSCFPIDIFALFVAKRMVIPKNKDTAMLLPKACWAAVFPWIKVTTRGNNIQQDIKLQSRPNIRRIDVGCID